MAGAIVLFSGGLDSLLAVRALQEQEIQVTGLNIVTPFQDGSDEARQRAESMKIELVTRSLGNEYLTMLEHPRWGVGKGVNPCIDCRIAMLCEAKKLMEERGADFVATGEIVGQRPNSQMMHQLNLITRESGLGKKLVRPLSAKVLPATEPEETGLLDREKLLACTGRGRTGLIALARRRFQISSIPQPSTGCLLSEKSFAPRVRDLLAHKPNPTAWDARLLKIGRHFRINDQTKAVVARRQADCDALKTLFADPAKSRSALFVPENFNGPALLLVKEGKLGNLGDAVDSNTVSESGNMDASDNADPFDDSLRAIAGGLILRFDKPAKRAHLTGMPTVHYFTRPDRCDEIPIAPNAEADSLSMILPKEEKAKNCPPTENKVE